MPAASMPVWAAKPAVNTVRLAARPSPAAPTAVPAANNASGSTAKGVTREILATSPRAANHAGRTAKLATTGSHHNSLINTQRDAVTSGRHGHGRPGRPAVELHLHTGG